MWILQAIGGLTCIIAAPYFYHSLLVQSPGRWKRILFFIIDAGSVAGAVVGLLFPSQTLAWILLSGALFAMLAYGLVFIAVKLHTLADAIFKRAIAVFLTLPAYFLILNCLTIVSGLRYLNRPAYTQGNSLTPYFLSTCHITNREREIIGSFVLLPITLYCFSPVLSLSAASAGIISESVAVFGAQLIASLLLGRLLCGWAPLMIRLVFLILQVDGMKAFDFFYQTNRGISVTDMSGLIACLSVALLFFVLSVTVGRRSGSRFPTVPSAGPALTPAPGEQSVFHSAQGGERWPQEKTLRKKNLTMGIS